MEILAYIAKLARDLVDFSSSSIGTMATVYPQDHPDLSGVVSCFTHRGLLSSNNTCCPSPAILVTGILCEVRTSVHKNRTAIYLTILLYSIPQLLQ